MLNKRLYEFVREERGGGTIMGLFWFMMLVGITGLAVDTTDGLRNRTMLQATADAAVLAGVIDLPDETLAVGSAVVYSTNNMPGDLYGEVLQAEDVEIGAWHMDSRSFELGGLAPNPLDPTGPMLPDSIRVTLHQTDSNANAVPVNFLRIIGLQTWNVNVEAVAQRFIPDCLQDGLVARGLVDISSNNGFVNRICIHGQKGVAMQNHNFHELGVTVSMPNIGGQLQIPTGGMESNPGLPDALREQSLDPRMVNHVGDFMDDLLLLEPYILPNYIDPDNPIIVENKNFDFTGMLPGHVYHIDCKANQSVGIPQDTVLTRVVIVSDCQVGIGSNVFMHDVILASRAGGNPGQGGSGGGTTSGGGGSGIENANINGASGVVLGVSDNCALGGGVQIFSNASVKFSSTTSYNGVQIVATGDVDLGARDMGINGINVQAGGNITLTSNNAFGICATGAPNLQTVAYYRLVH
jgi:hypothetical protein